MADWKALQAEYIAGGISIKKLAEKHGVNETTLRHKAVDGAWNSRRKKVGKNARKKSAQKLDDKIAGRKSTEIVRGIDTAKYTALLWQDTLKDMAQLISTNKDAFVTDPNKVAAMSNAIAKNIDSLFKACRILSVQEERKLQLDERRIALEEKKYAEEQEEKRLIQESAGKAMWRVQAPEGDVIDE